MLKSEFAANPALIASNSTMIQRAAKIMKMDKSFAFRLAALNALDTNKGKIH